MHSCGEQLLLVGYPVILLVAEHSFGGRHVEALPFRPLETPHGPVRIGGVVKTAQDIVVMRVVC